MRVNNIVFIIACGLLTPVASLALMVNQKTALFACSCAMAACCLVIIVIGLAQAISEVIQSIKEVNK